jgi:hypothetical protein
MPPNSPGTAGPAVRVQVPTLSQSQTGTPADNQVFSFIVGFFH